MKRQFPMDITRIIARYCMEWTVLPWVLERAPKINADRHPSGKMLHWHGELYGEQEDLFGEGITENGGILVESWDEEPENKWDKTREATEEEPIEPCGESPYDNKPEYYIWENPRAEHFLRGMKIDWIALAANPADWALDLLELLKSNTEWYPTHNLCRNTNPRVIPIIERMHPSHVDNFWLCANPIMINKIRSDYLYPLGILINKLTILWNPAAKDLIAEAKISIQNHHACFNPDPWPELKAVQDSYSLDQALCDGYGRNINDYAIERMRTFDGWTPLMLDYLYTNPSPAALAMIRDDPERFPLRPVIWSNPGIFELTVPPGLIDAIATIEF